MLKRVAFFAYGVASYGAFFFTFLYAIGFVGDFWVPTRLDAPAAGPTAAALLVDLGLLTVFALQHSVMARPAFKRQWTRIVPQPLERSTYVLFASLALLLLFAQWRPLGGAVWSVEHPAGRIALYALCAFGWGLVLLATFLIDHFDLFGLRQVWLHLVGREYTPVRFQLRGPYRMVRHPLYLGFMLAFWATPNMTSAHLVFALMTSAYILVAIQLEERDLVSEHGERYLSYRERVPMLVPSLRRERARVTVQTA